MYNHRFSPVTSNVIMGTLVLVTSMIIWFTMQAFTEIAAIEESIAAGSEIYD